MLTKCFLVTTTPAVSSVTDEMEMAQHQSIRSLKQSSVDRLQTVGQTIAGKHNSGRAGESVNPDLVSLSPAGSQQESWHRLAKQFPPAPWYAVKADSPTFNSPRQNATWYQSIQQGSPLTAQITSVSQLSDVNPSDWAFQALQSLVERNRCIAGYAGGTFQGNRTLTRYEFAAAMNACLSPWQEQQLSAVELETIRRLQDEFKTELATLRGRVDNLEASAAELEANQFSTTTKLTGQVIFALTDVSGDERAIPAGDSPKQLERNVLFSDRVRLQFNTSFTGSDILGLEVEAGNTPNLREATGTNMSRLAFDQGEQNDLTLSQLFYQFPIGNSANFAVVLNGQFFDFVETLNPLVGSDLRGSVSRFGVRSPIYRAGGGGAGASFSYDFSDFANLTLVYLSSEANNTTSGLFAGPYATLAQLTLEPSENVGVGLTYVRSFNEIATGTGSDRANNPFGTASNSITANFYGLEVTWRVSSTFTISGWVGLAQAAAEDLPDQPDAEIFNYAVNFAFPDLGKKGNLLGIALGQPPKVNSNDLQLIDPDTSLHLEAFYRFQVTDNISITPGVVVITNPEHNSSNDTIYIGTIRTTFTF